VVAHPAVFSSLSPPLLLGVEADGVAVPLPPPLLLPPVEPVPVSLPPQAARESTSTSTNASVIAFFILKSS
jgi:hypothetical protein